MKTAESDRALHKLISNFHNAGNLDAVHARYPGHGSGLRGVAGRLSEAKTAAEANQLIQAAAVGMAASALVVPQRERSPRGSR